MEITNYTRYNTDDIKAMVDSIQLESSFTGWRSGISTLTISEFNPSNAYITVRSYNQATKQHKRYVSKTVWSRPGQMSILTPTKIYENPLEELVQNGEQEVPKAMLQAVMLSLRNRANYTDYKASSAPIPAHLRLRVMKKAATKKPKSDKSAVAAREEYAARNIRVVQWSAHKCAGELRRLAKKHLGVTETHLKERKHMVQPLRDAVLAAELALQQVVNLAVALQSTT
jgi:hypothetical protein